MRQPRFSQDDIERGYEEIRDESDRSVAIVAATILEATLEDAIVSRLLPMSNTHQSILFEGEGCLASFAPKIDLGLVLGLFEQKTKADLHYIRKIRNEFAHHPNRDFGHPVIVKHCKLLTDYSTTPKNLEREKELRSSVDNRLLDKLEYRWRYIFAALELTTRLLKEACLNSAAPPKSKFLADAP